MVTPSSILLAPPLQFSKGSAWATTSLPQHDFLVTAKFSISGDAPGGGLAIWLVSEYGLDGTFFGGSPFFEGLAIIGEVSQTEVRFFCLENRGHSDFSQILPELEPQFKIQFRPGRPFSLTFRIGRNLAVSQLSELYTTMLTVDLTDAFLGITAQCGQSVSRIDLFEVSFPQSDDLPARDAHAGPHRGRFSPQYQPMYRSPRYRRLLEIVENRTNLTIDDLFCLIDEVYAAAFDAATFGSVDRFVREQIVPYADRWQRRTLRIVEEMERFRGNLTTAWNFTGQLMNAFRETLMESSARMTEKISGLGELIEEDSLDSHRHSIEIGRAHV